jgi:hypothetical protein
VPIIIVGEIQVFVFWIDYYFKDFNVFVVGWHVPGRNLNTKER